VKDAAQDLAEDELGAAKDGGVKREGVHREGLCLVHRHLPAAEPTPRLPLVNM